MCIFTSFNSFNHRQLAVNSQCVATRRVASTVKQIDMTIKWSEHAIDNRGRPICQEMVSYSTLSIVMRTRLLTRFVSVSIVYCTWILLLIEEIGMIGNGASFGSGVGDE
ncbi:hypothetical protein CFOL_v3_35427 [Cephalotus follicularis]|uniref:Uncharacterized protein n=1 Tax=Cephalotus follicularis TaxID=3775 RepID=A0A1Q3DIA8_CEPFO|nr:hypothetical protein CFOL_v3_35427 [Cephalotus follicularis]